MKISFSDYAPDSGIGLTFGCLFPQNPWNFVNKTGTLGRNEKKICACVCIAVSYIP